MACVSASAIAIAMVKEKEKASRQVVEFTDEDGVVGSYFQKMNFEVNENYRIRVYCDSDSDDEKGEEFMIDTPRETLFKYVNQIRDSFGFDVDCVVPRWFEGDFFPVDLSDEKQYERMKEGAEFAMDEINADMGSKSYELVDVERAVMRRDWIMLLTLTAKKVAVAVAVADPADPEAKRQKIADPVVIIQAMVYKKAGRGFMLEQWRFKPATPLPLAVASLPLSVASDSSLPLCVA